MSPVSTGVKFAASLSAAAGTVFASWFTNNAVNDVNKEENWIDAKSVYDFSLETIDGEEVKLDKYRNQVLLVVNLACVWSSHSKKNFKQLAMLNEEYSGKGLKILGIASSQFGFAELSNSDIKKFVMKHDVKYDLFADVKVNGSDAHPLYKYLKSKQSGLIFSMIKWNFTKFLVDKNGQPVKRYSPFSTAETIAEDLPEYL